MVHIAIVEDEIIYINQLKEFIKRYKEESGENIKVSVFTDGDEIVEEYKGEYDIILMDIQMEFMDGMKAAEHIRKYDGKVIIIFITNMPQYAINGYAVGALDYILKPLTYFPFSQRLSRAIERIKKREEKYITFVIKGGTIRMALSDIYYIESQRHLLIFHTKNGIYESPGTMKAMEEKLKDLNFFRGHHGYLINLEQVDGIKGNQVIVRGTLIQLSRSRKNSFMDALSKYWGEQ